MEEIQKHLFELQDMAYRDFHSRLMPGIDKETIYTCYVMDEKRRLEGVVTVKDLLMNDYAALMGDIMDPHVIKAYTTEDQEKVVETFNLSLIHI